MHRINITILCAIAVELVIIAVLYLLPLRQAEHHVRGMSAQIHESVSESLMGGYSSPYRGLVAHISQQLTDDFSELMAVRWYASVQQCSAHLVSVGDYVVAPHPRGRLLKFTDPVYPLTLSVHCIYRINVFMFWGLFMAILIAFLCYLRYRPLPDIRLYWVKKLCADGASILDALRQTERLERAQQFNRIQREYLSRFYDSQASNFKKILAESFDPKVASLSDDQLKWLHGKLGGQGDDTNISEALSVAATAPGIQIDLALHKLHAHGVEILMPKTPFFYYVWYALRRAEGDGWYVNPQSNKFDRDSAQALIQLMWDNGGHAKAIADLEQHGIKAKILDQNRSKIKQHFIQALGEELAQPYMFLADRDPCSDRMRYQLLLEPDQIQFQ